MVVLEEEEKQGIAGLTFPEQDPASIQRTGKITAENIGGLTFPGVGIIATADAADEVATAKEKEVALAGEEPEDDEEGDLADVFEEDEELKQKREAIEAAQGIADEFSADLDELRGQIDSFKITDAALNTQINSISARWGVRIDEMRNVNKRREKAFETLGFRTGARFSGGVKGGIFGGIIAEEERQGILRIGQLESLKQQEISAARAAAREQNWDVYVKKVDAAQDDYELQLKQIEKLNELYIERQDELEEERKAADETRRKVSIDNAVVSLFQQGVTDPATILDFLNFSEEGELIGDITIEDIKETIEFLDKMKPEEGIDLSKASTDVRDFALFFPDVDIGTPEGFQQFLDYKKRVKGEVAGSADVKDFQLFFPDVDIGTPEGYQQFLRFKARMAAAGRKPEGDKDFITFGFDEKSRLLGAGISQEEIEAVQTNLNNGVSLEEIINASGLTDEESQTLRNVMVGVTPTQERTEAEEATEAEKQFLNQGYFEGLFTESQMKEAANKAGFRKKLTSWSTEKKNYLDHLMGLVEQYRQAGFTDQEILKQMQ